VVRLDPFHFTTDVDRNPVPFTVRLNAAPPAVALAGDSEPIVGTGLFAALIVNVDALEVPPPGVGLKTVTDRESAVARNAAVIAALTCGALTNAVVRLDPFHFTTDVDRNPVPFTVRLNAAPPAVALVGDNEPIVGTGLFAALIVNVKALEVPPPGVGLKTV